MPVEDEIEEDEEPAPEPKVKAMPKKPAAKAKGSMRPPEPEGLPPKDANLTEVVFTFKDGSGAVVRRMFPMLTERQKSRVQKSLATAPWRESQLKPRGEGKVDRQTRPAVDQTTVSYLKGTRLFVPTSRVRRKGLMKQFKAAPRFRERVGIRKKLFGTVPRGTAGEAMVRRILDDESDCGSCQSRRKKTKLPADLYY